MDYDLRSLGTRQFEHLTQALALKYINQQVSIFGSGPDGGREATWEGPANSEFTSNWDGLGVLQAKHKEHESTPKDHATWLIAQLKAELRLWADETSNRKREPEYFVAATNVRLSAVPEAGVDHVVHEISELAKELKLPIKGFTIWHYDTIRVMLDNSRDIRDAYTAWITPGDVIARLLESGDSLSQNLQTALRAHAGKTLLDDRMLNLTQAGSYSDAATGIAEAFVDLPFSARMEDIFPANDTNGRVGEQRIADQILRASNDPDIPAAGTAQKRTRRTVIVGGPGQGKSTVGQFLCQVYRASFLKGHSAIAEPEVAKAVDILNAEMLRLELDAPISRRWPIRVKLTDLADSLAAGSCGSLLEFIAQQVSKRSSLPISLADISTWLRTYPWFVVLDGLDEVPVASNRSQVMGAVGDFMVDVAASSADVAVLATTRPQGYSDEFSPSSFRHLGLIGLDVVTAQAYADRLLVLRLGQDSERKERASERLRSAFAEESTLRLMNTPLQVTILTLLVERFGQAPRDRWKLFSQYYTVIYQRELEKGGPLAEILEQHESDINAIHRTAGYLLQQRGEIAGESASLLTRTAFKDLILERLREEGHSEDHARELADTIERLTTNRLVFLAALQEDRLGFEIRSLQEFMAGEHVVEIGQSNMLDALQPIALSAYWRNVFLFAVGRIFEDRQHFRGEVTTLCDLLNRSVTAVGSVASGALIAMTLLGDGIGRKQPLHYRSLLLSAVEVLRLGPTPYAQQLATMCVFDSVLDSQVGIELVRIVKTHGDPRRLGALVALTKRCDEGVADPSEVDQVTAAIQSMSGDIPAIDALLDFALAQRMPTLLTCLGKEALKRSPDRYLGALCRNRDDEGLSILAEQGAPWQRALAVLAEAVVNHRPHIDKESSFSVMDSPSVWIAWRPLTSPTTWPTDLSVPRGVGPAWSTLTKIGRFATSPSAQTLAEALQSLADSGSPTTAGLVRYAPWPLAACYDDARWGHDQEDEDAVGLRLAELAEAAAVGQLGDLEQWTRAEKRWRDSGSVDDLFVIGPPLTKRPSGSPAPIWPALESEGAALQGATVYMTHNQDGLTPQTIETFFKKNARRTLEMKPTSQRQEMVALLLFIVGAGLRDRPQSLGAEEVDPKFKETRERIVDDPEFLPLASLAIDSTWGNTAWITFLAPEQVDRDNIQALLMAAGRRPRLANLGLRAEVLKSLWQAWVRDEASWPLGRLVVWSDPTHDVVDMTTAPTAADLSGAYEAGQLALMETVRLIGGGRLEAESLERLSGGPIRPSHDQGAMATTLRDSLRAIVHSRALVDPEPRSSLAPRFEAAVGLAALCAHSEPSVTAELLARVSEAISQLPAGTAVEAFDNPAGR